LRPCKFDKRVAQNPSDFPGPGVLWLVESTHRTNISPQAHSAIRASILIDFDKNPSRDLVMLFKCMDSPHRAVRETSLAGDAFILVCLHKTSTFENVYPVRNNAPLEFLTGFID
jgi:hypothetical protein